MQALFFQPMKLEICPLWWKKPLHGASIERLLAKSRTACAFTSSTHMRSHSAKKFSNSEASWESHLQKQEPQVVPVLLHRYLSLGPAALFHHLGKLCSQDLGPKPAHGQDARRSLTVILSFLALSFVPSWLLALCSQLFWFGFTRLHACPKSLST